MREHRHSRGAAPFEIKAHLAQLWDELGQGGGLVFGELDHLGHQQLLAFDLGGAVLAFQVFIDDAFVGRVHIHNDESCPVLGDDESFVDLSQGAAEWTVKRNFLIAACLWWAQGSRAAVASQRAQVVAVGFSWTARIRGAQFNARPPGGLTAGAVSRTRLVDKGTATP